MTGRGVRAWVAGLLVLGAPCFAAEVTASDEPKRLRGFDLDLTFTEASGLTTATDAYENVLSVTFDPKFALGKRFFAESWAEPLILTANFDLNGELSGNDPIYRSSGYPSPQRIRDSPEQVLFTQATQNGAGTPTNGIDGAFRRSVVSDLRLAAAHDKVLAVPKIGVQMAAGARLVLPTSSASQAASLWAAPSLGLGLHREFGRLDLRWEVRGTKYLFARTVPSPAGSGGKVVVGGLEVDPYRPASTGTPNPSLALANVLSASAELPWHLTLGAEYALVNTWTYPLTNCQVPDQPTVDVCRDDAALGTVQSVGQRDNESFWVELGWKPTGWGSLGLGLATLRPVRAPDGRIANPFLQINRDNYSTAYLALYVNAEALASLLGAAAEPASRGEVK